MKFKFNFYLALFGLVLLFGCTTEPAIEKESQSDWRGPNRDGIYQETGLLTQWQEGGPELLWKFSELGLGFSSPAIVGDQMFINGTIDSVSYLFNLDLNGNLKWKKAYAFP